MNDMDMNMNMGDINNFVLEHHPLLQSQTMALTNDEIRWALEIKEAVIEAADNNKNAPAEDNDEDNDANAAATVTTRSSITKELTDYEYAVYAIHTRGDTDMALDKIEKMQEFRLEYNIHDTVEEGIELLMAMSEQQKWFFVHVDYSAPLGRFICVMDYEKLKPAAVVYPDDYRVLLGGFYYLNHLLQSNLLACREGVVLVAEFMGVGMEHFDHALFRTFWDHLFNFYPVTYREVSWLHTNVVGNLLHAFHKQIMQSRANVIRVGCQFPSYDGRIDDIFKAPSETFAHARLMTQYVTFLSVRYHHQVTFQLPPPEPNTAQAAGAHQLSDNDDDDDDNDDDDDEDDDYMIDPDLVVMAPENNG